MAHRRKSKEDKNLIYIENKDKSSVTIASKVILMYEDDFNLTISEIASILKCERQWVNKYVQGNVKHIFLNEQYRRFLMELNRSHSITEERLILKDYYYFSRKDFYRWLKENTVATKQTQRLDINIHSDNISEFKKLRNEHIEALKNSKNVISLGIEVLTYEDKIKDTLSPLGQKIFSKKLGVLNRKDTSEIKLKNFNLPEELVSIKELKNWYGKSLEIVYRDLYKYGAIKYTIAGSLVRYDSQFAVEDFEQSEFSYLITIPYEYYIRKVKRIKKRRGRLMSYGISREEEHQLPRFKNHDEARKYFKDKYGDSFQLMDSDIVDDEKIYFYKLILNMKVYKDMIKELEKSGYASMNEDRMFCSQDIQIFENGSIHIIH